MSNPSPPRFIRYWHRFRDRLYIRLKRGHAAYGDESFEKDLEVLIDEIQQELEDVCGWGLILWVGLERLKVKARMAKEKLKQMEARAEE